MAIRYEDYNPVFWVWNQNPVVLPTDEWFTIGVIPILSAPSGLYLYNYSILYDLTTGVSGLQVRFTGDVSVGPIDLAVDNGTSAFGQSRIEERGNTAFIDVVMQMYKEGAGGTVTVNEAALSLHRLGPFVPTL